MSKKDDSGEKKKRIVSKYNPDALRQCVLEGMSAENIMEKLSVKNKPTLRKHLLRLMQEDKQFYEINGLEERSAHPTVNKQGVLRLNLSGLVMEDKTVESGDSFTLSVEGNQIILTRVE